MRWNRLAALATAVALLGCPLPQPLPDYPAGAITPPRILVDGIAGQEAAIRFVPADCAAEPVYPLTVTVHDSINEAIEARWFVNYDALYQLSYNPIQSDTVLPDPDALEPERTVPPNDPDTGAARPFLFRPYQYPPAPGAPSGGVGPPFPGAGIVRVVDLVVSNGFDPEAVAPPGLPYRTTLAGFETQVYSWVFLSIPEPGGCAPGFAGCCPAPP